MAPTKGKMKLRDALDLLNKIDEQATVYPVGLITGATAEPLSTFLAAYLQRRLPNNRVVIRTGLFGDLGGNLERHLRSADEPGVLLIEWADLDGRLGMRQAGGWGRSVSDDIVETVSASLIRLLTALRTKRGEWPVLIVPPTIPLAPVLPVPGWQMTGIEAKCGALLGRFLSEAVALPGVSILGPQVLDGLTRDRLDLRALWRAGAPYQVPFASELSEQIANALVPAPRAKGIITDLDDTLWAGILGEAGVAGVGWDLDHHGMAHGIYQQFLQSLAEDGVLVAVASKNDRQRVDECLARPDLLLKRESIFPIEAHWQPKTESVERILRTWNIGPERVVFVDDNGWEVEAMQLAFPQMDCRTFPGSDPGKLPSFLRDLTDLFGKAEWHEEDKLRLKSIRGGAERSQLLATGALTAEEILRVGAGELSLAPLTVPPDARALELVNKTNQFNLNGIRYSQAEWCGLLQGETGLARIASYRDKFGSHGKIAVLAGEKQVGRLYVRTWVLSCRVLSRRIEHTMLSHLFEDEGLEEIILQFRRTDRNGPVRDFIEGLTGKTPEGDVSITRELFEAKRPELYLSVATSA